MQIYLPYLWHFTTLRSHSDLFQWQTTIIHIHTLICIHHQNKQQLFAHDVQYENLWHLKSTPSKQFMQVKGKGKNTESNFLVSGDDHQPVLLPALPAESACLQQAGEYRACHLVANFATCSSRSRGRTSCERRWSSASRRMSDRGQSQSTLRWTWINLPPSSLSLHQVLQSVENICRAQPLAYSAGVVVQGTRASQRRGARLWESDQQTRFGQTNKTNRCLSAEKPHCWAEG